MNAILNLWKNKKIKNWSIVIIALIVVALVGLGFSSANASDTSVAAEATVVSLDVAETIESSGSLEAQPFASLDWKTSGVVEAVNVRPGDFVKAGDILVMLDPTSTSAGIVSAQADLVNAQKKLEDLLTSSTGLAQAAIDLKNAQEDYDDAVNYLHYLQVDTKVPQTKYLAELVQTRNGWKYEYTTENFKGPAPEDWIIEAENDLALKKAELEDAQREYDRLLAGETSSDVIAAQAQVDAAQATVNSLSIIAPFDGEVLSVDSRVGDVVSTGELSVNIADMDQLYVEAQVDESDVANVKLGNQAEVTLDAVPDLVLTGSVVSINPVGEVVGGLVKYTVRVELETVQGVFLPLGSTANVVIKLSDVQAVLAVPMVAIQNDSKGEYVWAVRGGEPVRVDVVGGSIVGELVAVTGDLQDGETLQIVARGSSFTAPNLFGGGNE
ncbi:MAG: efflux RND transporter periplasmic adaptor subunit [Anaerolineales bacterium]|nr:efflux RND transporter periplasmic adaptor subunit [Anaerolineales bacterium]